MPQIRPAGRSLKLLVKLHIAFAQKVAMVIEVGRASRIKPDTHRRIAKPLPHEIVRHAVTQKHVVTGLVTAQQEAALCLRDRKKRQNDGRPMVIGTYQDREGADNNTPENQ
jgi:hypothetical protein